MAGSEVLWAGSTPTDWVSAVGGLAGFSALTLTLLRQRRLRRRPPDELRDRLLELEAAFGDMIAAGGKESLWFLSPERRREESLLGALAGQLVDDELNRLVGEARGAYLDCFSWAPGHGSHDPSGTQKQIEMASVGRVATVQAIDRMNALVRDAA